jgi:hypothetical protein
MKKNFKILTGLLAAGAIILIVLSVLIHTEPGKHILLYAGESLVLAVFVQVIIFKVRPQSFGDKSKNPD